MAKYLITGGAGFIGSHLAELLARAGVQVSVFDNFSSGYRANLRMLDGAGLIEPDTLDGTIRLIQRFLAMPHEVRDAMRARGLDCYQNRYALRNSVQEV